MPILNILKAGDVDEFDNLPLFTGEARKRFFCLTKESVKTLSDINAPLDFLNAEDYENILDSKGKIRITLYKILLFIYIVKGIKSGTLSILYSYKYRAFDDYLIPLEYWNANKKELFSRAGLENFSDFTKVEAKRRAKWDEQLEKTNKAIESGKNEYSSIDADGKIKVKTPAKEETLKDRD